jgi:hypothetical protein
MSYIIDQWNKGEVAIDDNVLGWKMKDGEFRPLMSDALNELFYEGYINWGMVDDTNRARKLHEAKTLEAYREARANRTREQKREERAEMLAAFGPGEEVVNVLTGETFTTDTPAEVEVESDELNETGGWSKETLASMKRNPNLNVSDDAIAKVGKSIVRQAKAKTSKKARVAAIIEAWNKDPFYVVTLHRAELIDEIVKALGVTKANAGVYVYNYKKARGL